MSGSSFEVWRGEERVREGRVEVEVEASGGSYSVTRELKVERLTTGAFGIVRVRMRVGRIVTERLGQGEAELLGPPIVSSAATLSLRLSFSLLSSFSFLLPPSSRYNVSLAYTMGSDPLVSTRISLAWSPAPPEELTSTLVLTGRTGAFIDLRVFTSGSHVGEIDWATAGLKTWLPDSTPGPSLSLSTLPREPQR